ncbi:hypothetical protein DV451_000404 [Geotrichum candidum]|uniref:Uricase n=1 Tax=Geotrichum candidum TaxID=1173061 RepID=A0A0J9XGW8_GEOCN|nr:hypothetical protein DV451_000404 [Geotrichum candidum]KAI9213141.1 hypothetical protein DS838_001945 [Geotrichum bryndzae]KAF5105056.1 hypothetical protein DV453_005097 [Geotrichum candidum]KAF5112991.1 hypothetical protein DV452_003833 [Geotrichum candidum]KAF5114851.1 hypothetical protein DV454_002677 [Geotrichum candidum]
MSVFLESSKYGKDNVRVLKVKRDPQNPAKQEVIELTVRVLLEGEIEESYTKADNASIVPTDTVKNTTFILAKQHDVWPIERFGATLANHFVTKYAHIHAAEAHIIQHRWTKYNVQGTPHLHSFIQDGAEVRTATVYKKEGEAFKITSGIKDLTVLKSTGSKFYGYNVCDFTTLKETHDRILSTDVDAQWTWIPSKVSTYEAVNELGEKGEFDSAYEKARNITLETFALENSASVQATMYNISESILKEAPLLDTVTYLLPNKHYVELDLSWHHGLKNTGKDAEVYVPLNHPNGLIKSVVKRTPSKL